MAVIFVISVYGYDTSPACKIQLIPDCLAKTIGHKIIGREKEKIQIPIGKPQHGKFQLSIGRSHDHTTVTTKRK